MKVELNVLGLDCGHCALTLEKYLQKVDGVKSCNINFSTSKLFLEIDDDRYKSTMKNIYKTAKEVNPSVTITEDNDSKSTINLTSLILYLIGVVIGLIVVFVSMNSFCFWTLLVLSAVLMGYKTYYKAIIQLKTFKINENTLITISVVGAIAIGESMEGLMVIALYTLGKMLESKAVNYSRKSISALINNQPEYAIIIKDDKEVMVKPETVEIGQLSVVRAGEKVALDGVIESGCATIDKSHLTGESLPITVKEGDQIESGCIVLDSSLTIRVTSRYQDGTLAKILGLVSNATAKKSKTETIVSKFSSWYTLGVIIASIIVFAITWLVLKDVSSAIYRGLIFLVVSCPCAFAISVPLSYFSGIGRCSKQGILIKGSSFIDSCATTTKIVFDKTGTLTSGKFRVVKVTVKKGTKKEDMLKAVVAGEKNSIHPLAVAICEYYGKNTKLKVKNFVETAGIGLQYEIGKDKYFVGKSSSTNGDTTILVKKNNKEIGKIFLKDEIKSEAKEVISEIKELGIKTLCLSGDNIGIVKSVAETLALDEVRGGLMPEDKFKIIEFEKNHGENIAFVGDGLNDAPALTLANTGISMGIMGSDATIETSDVVIADDNLRQIPKLIKISRKTRRIALGNILFAGITKLVFLTLGAIGVTGMAFAVFADVGVTLLAILNSLRVLVYKVK